MKRDIWVIGGGKGGTGKSVASSLFASAAALKGKKVILIDGDLGGANLHTFFRIPPEKSSLNDFFEKKIPLTETLIDTDINGLQLISGDMRSYNPLSVRYIQRLKFYRHIKELDADVVIVDLGAGTALNTLDTFLLADKMILVSTPEMTSIENMYLFVKKIIIRKIRDMLNYEGFKDLDHSILKNVPDKRGTIKFSEFISQLKGLGKDQEKIVSVGLGSLKVNLVLNQIREKEYAKYGVSLKSVLKRHFNIDALFSGYLEYNEKIRKLANGDIDIHDVMDDPSIRSSVESVTENIVSGADVNFEEIQ